MMIMLQDSTNLLTIRSGGPNEGLKTHFTG